jgi:hypothetical protein
LTSDPHNDDAIVHYLLGELPEEKQTELEARYFADDELHDRIRAVETELAEAYVRGELGTRERERFEARLAASPRLGERVAFVRALLEVLPVPREETKPATPAPSRWTDFVDAVRSWSVGMRIAAAAAAALLVLGGLWVVYRAWRTPDRPPEQAGPGQNAPPVEVPRPPDVAPPGPEPVPPVVPAPPQPAPPAVATLVLTPGLSRGENNLPRLVLPAGTTRVRLTLPLGGETGTGYRATLKAADSGNAVWWRGGLAATRAGSSTAVVVTIRAQLLREKAYVVTLDHTVDGETETVEEYPFRVTMRER